MYGDDFKLFAKNEEQETLIQTVRIYEWNLVYKKKE